MKHGTPMSFRDLFIASIAIVNGMPIITLDEDFKLLKELGVDVHVI